MMKDNSKFTHSNFIRNSKFEIRYFSLKLVLFLLTLMVLPFPADASTPSVAQRLAGRIVQLPKVQRLLWYVSPVNGQRYLIHNDPSCLEVVRLTAIGINDKNLNKIPGPNAGRRDPKLVNRLRGRFLLAVEQQGAAFYLNPVDGRRAALTNGQQCQTALRRFATAATAKELGIIPMNGRQTVFDPYFTGVTSASIVHDEVVPGHATNQIMPIASLSKLMTALVLLDLNPDWGKEITITADDLNYPRGLVDPGDVTSEVPFAAGDTVTVRDLWRAMLVASSNQAAAMLAKHSGLSLEAFTAAMNDRAQLLGLEKTAFVEPSGLDPFNVSTAVEMAKIAAAAFGQPQIADTSVMGEFTITAKLPDNTTRDITVVNRNYSLLQFGVSAAKTGFLYEAQRTVAVRKGETIAVVLHARSMKERNKLLAEMLPR